MFEVVACWRWRATGGQGTHQGAGGLRVHPQTAGVSEPCKLRGAPSAGILEFRIIRVSVGGRYSVPQEGFC